MSEKSGREGWEFKVPPALIAYSYIRYTLLTKIAQGLLTKKCISYENNFYVTVKNYTTKYKIVPNSIDIG